MRVAWTQRKCQNIKTGSEGLNDLIKSKLQGVSLSFDIDLIWLLNHEDSSVGSVETVETLVSNYFPGLSNIVFELLLDLEPAATQQRNETYLQASTALVCAGGVTTRY